MPKINLGLRGNGHQVEVIQPDGARRPVLGRSQPEDESRRIKILRQWGVVSDAPRAQALAGIDIALSQRSQTILSHQVDAALRQAINGGSTRLPDTRRHHQEPTTVAVNMLAPEAEE